MAYTANINNTKETRRAQLKSSMDEFTTFQWRGEESFETYGMFILNDKKGSLKFYNGPGFSNEYSKPQFDSAGGNLLGITFNKQTISFSVGVYWFTEKEYRQIMNWLNPLVTSYIIFDFEPKYRYNVKLSKIGDSTRWIVGRNENGEKTYYTELNLSFEVQGVQCAIGVHSYEWYCDNSSDNEYNETTGELISDDYSKQYLNLQTSEFEASDLPTPINVNLELKLKQFSDNPSNPNPIYHPNDSATDTQDKLKLTIYHNSEYVDLFNITFMNLTYDKVDSTTSANNLSIKYNSETGLVFIAIGSEYKILTLQTTTDSGRRIVRDYVANKFLLPGKFDYPDFYEGEDNIRLELEWKRGYASNTEVWYAVPTKDSDLELSRHSGHISKFQIECYPRTNII